MSTVFTSDYQLVLDLSGIRWLGYRDIPDLIKKYVTTGNFALDYGCGKATSTMLMKSLGLNVEGVDVSADMIESAKKCDPCGTYTVIESGKLPSQDNTYDLIFMGLVLHFMKTKEEIRQVLKEVYRCLKQGGIAMVMVPTKNAFLYNTYSTNRDFVENNAFYDGSLTKILFQQTGTVMSSYYWNESVYCEVITDVGLTLMSIHSPLGNDSDKYSWTVEKEKPFFQIFIAKKTT